MTDTEMENAVVGRLNQAQTALDDAKFLLDGGRSTQSVINRSYYAMFYAALALLEQIGRVPSKHAGVISLFDTEFVIKGSFSKQLSKDLHKAFELRQVSDYRVMDSISSDKAAELLQKATRFVEEVKGFLLYDDSDA
jgi:uncharacterized protein (UPF0332 family)